MDITFCTYYFDIDRKNWDEFTVPNEAYLNWFKNLLSLDINLYISTEEKFVQKIKQAREKIDPNFEKTFINVTTIEELPAYKQFNSRLEKLMFSEDFKKIVYHKSVPEMSKPLYNVLMFNKVNYLHEVAEKNPFNTDYFSWVDAGFIRSESDIVGMGSWPDPDKLKLNPDKIKFFCINKNIKQSIGNIRDHLLSQLRLLKGTIFFLHKNLAPVIRDKFNFYVDQSINNGYIGSDEKIFDLCCLNNPELFDLYKCNWREEIKLFSYNYTPPKEMVHNVLCEWTIDEIEKCDDYSYWFFCVEDENSESIIREDFIYGKDDDVLNFKKTQKSLKFLSNRVPKNFVIWPVSNSKGNLKPLKKNVKIMSEQAKANSSKINIDEYFFVNLDRRNDRLNFITGQINKSEILKNNIKKWTAIDGRDINPDWIPEKILTKRAYDDIVSGLPVVRGLSVTPGGLGFYLTHTKIFEYALSNNKNIFVMDDDINVNSNFDIEINQILSELPDTFDFCYLGYYDTQYQKIPYSKKLFIPKGQFCGPHGYIVSPKGAKKLLDLIFPIDIQLDSKLYTIQNNIEYYAAYDRLAAYADEYPTDIQHETGCVKNYEKTNTIKELEKNELTVVVARYNEDVSWTKKIKHKTIVFNKNENDYENFEKNLQNVGREGHTFFNYIVENYDSLTSHIAFVQGNPFDHCGDAIEVINNFDFNKDFLRIGGPYEESSIHESINNQVIKFAREIGFEITFPLHYIRGAQHIISKKLIWKRPKEFYQKILDTLKYEKYPHAALDVEKCLFQIYGFYKI